MGAICIATNLIVNNPLSVVKGAKSKILPPGRWNRFAT